MSISCSVIKSKSTYIQLQAMDRCQHLLLCLCLKNVSTKIHRVHVDDGNHFHEISDVHVHHLYRVIRVDGRQWIHSRIPFYISPNCPHLFSRVHSNLHVFRQQPIDCDAGPLLMTVHFPRYLCYCMSYCHCSFGCNVHWLKRNFEPTRSISIQLHPISLFAHVNYTLTHVLVISG